MNLDSNKILCISVTNIYNWHKRGLRHSMHFTECLFSLHCKGQYSTMACLGAPFSSVGRACVPCAEALQRTRVWLLAWVPLTPGLGPFDSWPGSLWLLAWVPLTPGLVLPWVPLTPGLGPFAACHSPALSLFPVITSAALSIKPLKKAKKIFEIKQNNGMSHSNSYLWMIPKWNLCSKGQGLLHKQHSSPQ